MPWYAMVCLSAICCHLVRPQHQTYTAPPGPGFQIWHSSPKTGLHLWWQTGRQWNAATQDHLGHWWIIHEFSISMISMSCLRSGKTKTCWPNCSLVFSLTPIQWHRFVRKWAIHPIYGYSNKKNEILLCFELFENPWEFGVLPWFYHGFTTILTLRQPQCWTHSAKSQVWCSCRSVPPRCRDSPHRSARWSCFGPRPWKWNSWDLWKFPKVPSFWHDFCWEIGKHWWNKWENWSRLLWKDGRERSKGSL